VDLDIGRAEVTLPAGGRVALGAAAILVDGRRVDASGRVRWVSRDPAIATVDERGVVHAISAGSTGIYAEWQGVLAPAVRIVVEE